MVRTRFAISRPPVVDRLDRLFSPVQGMTRKSLYDILNPFFRNTLSVSPLPPPPAEREHFPHKEISEASPLPLSSEE